ncbi:MAG: DUF3990 domain-containing protein [Bacteroidales bacterium]|nr:DUF3990 domain-containing protein [Bacteroidales bacterium]
MIVYHGSLEIVDTPEIRFSNRTLDYGTGFYTTTSFDQAQNWVNRRKKSAKYGFVNVYEIDIEEIKKSHTLWFDSPTEDWIDFVDSNRNHIGFTHDYDFVYGPVANDRVYAAFALYESGVLNKEDLIRELKVYNLVDQLLFHTESALKKLRYVETIRIDL